MGLAKEQCTYIILDTCLKYSRLLCDNIKQQESLADATKAFLDIADIAGYTDSTKLIDDYNAYLHDNISSEFLEQDNDDIACISCTHRYNKGCSSFCAIDDHYIFYANLWCQTCEQHMLIDTTQFGKGDADNATF